MPRRIIALFRGTSVESLLAKGSLHAFLIQGCGAMLLLLTEAIAARLLGIAQFGIYAVASAWILVLSLVATLGFNHALLRFVPTYVEHSDWGSLRGILRRSNFWVITAAVLMGGSGSLLLFSLQNCCVNPTIFPAFLVAFLIVPVMALSSLRQSVLRGLGKIPQALAPEWLVRPLIIILLLVVTSRLIPAPLQANTALVCVLVAAVAAFIVGAYWQRRALPDQLKAQAPIYRDREWLTVASPLLLIVGLHLISSRLDVIMLGLLSEIKQVGIYSAASRVADVVIFGLVSANAIVAPLIARLHATEQYADLQQMVKRSTKWICLFTVPIALTLLIFGREILSFFGEEFCAGYPILAILVSGQLVNALSGPVGYLMMMTGHQIQAARFVGISALINLMLNLLLIPFFGMFGAAIATAISTATWNLLMLGYVHKEIKIKSSAFHAFT